jgi:arylsulfatase A-like enzyme
MSVQPIRMTPVEMRQRTRFPQRAGPAPRARRRDLVKSFCQCVGLASILLVMNYGDLLGGGADVRMHVPYALVGICLAQLADIFLVALLLFALYVPLRRTRFYPFARLVLAVLIPLYVLYRTQNLMPFIVQYNLRPFLFVLWTVLVLLLYFRFNLWYRRLMRLGDTLGVFLFVFALSSMAQILWVTRWKPGPQQIHAAWETPGQPARMHPKIVWIVFDELSYDQVFEHRAHDLELPNFDALRGQSTLFRDAQPIGLKTVRIIPSLLTGQVVDDLRFGFDNSFKVHYTGVRGWHPVSGQQTIFGDAEQQGWRTAAVGWYNPYCAIYGDALGDCYFMNLDRIDGLMSQSDGFWRNTYSPLQQMVREIKAPARADRDICTYDVRQRYHTHVDLQQHALDVLSTDQADLVFLHMSIPHSPNLWSRQSDDYTQFCDSSYLDNLALVDRMLGQMMQTLESSPRWKDTTVIVEGDHSWRMFLWDWLPAWTDEDDAASRNGFDPRPAMLIHQAGQTQPGTVDAAWPILKVHGVVERALHGQPAQY